MFEKHPKSGFIAHLSQRKLKSAAYYSLIRSADEPVVI